MTLLELLNKNVLKIPLLSKTKEDVIRELVSLLKDSGAVMNPEIVIHGILDRERLGSTGLDKGIAVPHTRTTEVADLCVAMGISSEGIDFNSLDGKPAHLFFLILAPPEQGSKHIRMLSEIARISRNESICHQLRSVATQTEALSLLEQL